jgi:hypothetical protein
MAVQLEYPKPQFSTKTGTINLQFGSNTPNFGVLGASPNQYTNRAFCDVYVGLPVGVYNFEIKQVQITLPPAYRSQETFPGPATRTLPTPSFLLEGDLFNSPQSKYINDPLSKGGMILSPTTQSFHDTSGVSLIKSMTEMNTILVNPNWKCQYFNLTGTSMQLNLRIRNRNPANNFIVGFQNALNYWFDEPIDTITANPTWPWLCLDANHDIVDYPANSIENLFNVIITLEYNRISGMPLF